MKSATRLLLDKTYKEVWRRGEDYADNNKVIIEKSDERSIETIVKGSKRYTVSLKFAGSGLSRHCTCPYIGDVCKHMVATAILWDKNQGINRPSKEELESYTIPSPPVARAQIMKVFNDPLNADLETLRLASESTGWSRPHSRLPQKPNFSDNEKKSLSVLEIKKAFQEIASWTNRKNFDPYFCAGEMIAAFCETLRAIKKRLGLTPSLIGSKVLCEAQKFHYELVTRLIDDSDGHWQINETHLDDIYEFLKKKGIGQKEKTVFAEMLQEFETNKNEY